MIVGSTIYEAEALAENRGVRAVRLAKVTGQGVAAERGDSFACDLIAVSTGYAPTAPLISLYSTPSLRMRSRSSLEMSSSFFTCSSESPSASLRRST